jgi:hypothetical protein
MLIKKLMLEFKNRRRIKCSLFDFGSYLFLFRMPPGVEAVDQTLKIATAWQRQRKTLEDEKEKLIHKVDQLVCFLFLVYILLKLYFLLLIY